MAVLFVACPASSVVAAVTGRPSARDQSVRSWGNPTSCALPSCCRSTLSPLQDSWPLPLLWWFSSFGCKWRWRWRGLTPTYLFPLINGRCSQLHWCWVRVDVLLRARSPGFRLAAQLSKRAMSRVRGSLTRESHHSFSGLDLVVTNLPWKRGELG